MLSKEIRSETGGFAMTKSELEQAIEEATTDWKMTIGDTKELYWQILLDLYEQRDQMKKDQISLN